MQYNNGFNSINNLSKILFFDIEKLIETPFIGFRCLELSKKENWLETAFVTKAISMPPEGVSKMPSHTYTVDTFKSFHPYFFETLTNPLLLVELRHSVIHISQVV